jgi:starch phosphorylase
MKVLVNGGLNLSSLDGWWAEAYQPEFGWVVGGAGESDDDADAESLYRAIEDEIIPSFYERDDSGIPRAWVARIRASMTALTPRFSAHRTVQEYTEQYYVPLSRRYRARTRDKGAAAVELVEWRHTIERRLGGVHVGRVHRTTAEERGDGRHEVLVHLYLNDLPVETVRVELYAEPPAPGEPPQVIVMDREGPLIGSTNGHGYRATVLADRPAGDYTPRVVPDHPAAALPFDAAAIRWLE